MARIALGGFRADPDALLVGESTMPREQVLASQALSSGFLRLDYFTARRTESVSQIRAYTSGTAAGATPTLCRMGLYSVAASGDLTLVASTASDTTLFAAVNTAYTRSFTAPYTKVAGQRYATALLCVTAAVAPTVLSTSSGAGPTMNAIMADSPRLAGAVGAQTDLPGSVPAASIGAQAVRNYVVVLP